MSKSERIWRGFAGFFKRQYYGKWVVMRTIWPNPEGYGVYRPRDKTLLSSGLSEEEAHNEAEEMNRYYK